MNTNITVLCKERHLRFCFANILIPAPCNISTEKRFCRGRH